MEAGASVIPLHRADHEGKRLAPGHGLVGQPGPDPIQASLLIQSGAWLRNLS